jgi:hypothetical protein
MPYIPLCNFVDKCVAPRRSGPYAWSVAMPRGPQGQKRPADVIRTAIAVAKIATGEVEEALKPPSGKVSSGRAGGKAGAAKLPREERVRIAAEAAKSCWRR